MPTYSGFLAKKVHKSSEHSNSKNCIGQNKQKFKDQLSFCQKTQIFTSSGGALGLFCDDVDSSATG